MISACTTNNTTSGTASSATNSNSPNIEVHQSQRLHDAVVQRLEQADTTNTARNVILFVGDGMGISTITASRIFEGQRLGGPGEDHSQIFETFPYVALVKTYNSNQQVPDSAGTATALLSGVKTRAGVVGIGPNADRRNCTESLLESIPTIAEIAEDRGLSTGVVTTARVTHATPAASYAHVPEREWENDCYIPPEDWSAGCRDIAYQLVHFAHGDGLDVVLGGGRRNFLPLAQSGKRCRNENLIDNWLDSAGNRTYVTSLDEMTEVQSGLQVLGLFSDSHMSYMAERRDALDEPDLREMTLAAIDVLSSAPNGFFLLVEGGRIDHGHHEGRAGYALLEALEFNRAIEAALGRVNLDETLVLVTADHSHALSISGYPARGNPILDLVRGNDATGNPEGSPTIAEDGMPYTTLGYLNGPGAITGTATRPLPETGVSARRQALFSPVSKSIDGNSFSEAAHSGEDVAAFAIGPWAHLVSGVLDQHILYHIMTYAYGWSR